MSATARLLIECPDARGVVAAAASAVADSGGNILEADQHTDPDSRRFFMRLEFEPEADRSSFEAAFAPIAEARQMAWRVRWGDAPRRVAILCSKETHCLSDLLWRWQNGDLPGAEVVLVAGNHDTGRALAEAAGAPFHYMPIVDKSAKAEQEAELERLLTGAGAELVVLARYMQVLSAGFCERWRDRVINIHHSFLPAFAGARPYHQAFERGVKLIGASAHYATAELDDGPIIAQRTAPVSHRDTVQDLVRTGRDLERVTLAEAVRLHLQDKVLVSGRRTVVFD
ncbi:MAG: formyltetrahydrofolate deformylase [Planctomycetota bacterium]